MVATMHPARLPQAITTKPEMPGIADNIPAVIPTPIPMIPKGIITSNAPTKGMRRILSGRTSTMPINPPRTMAMSMLGWVDRTRYTTRATKPPANVPIKKSAIFKFILYAFSTHLFLVVTPVDYTDNCYGPQIALLGANWVFRHFIGI